MADQLLSQADVDALIASLSKNEPPKPAAPVAKPPAPAPVAATATAKPAVSSFPTHSSAPAPVSSISMANPASRPASAPVKPEANNETINTLNAKIAELTKQLTNLGAAVKRIETLEKRLNELESKSGRSSSSGNLDQKVQQLTDEMKKIVTNLKGTPGYGARNTFSCEKCSDEGHVAVQYRCTKCGHERWYGWWPDKKK
jgi:hypothetical protein